MVNNPKYCVITVLAKKMNIYETVSRPLVQMLWASGRITIHDLNCTLRLDINNFIQNFIPGIVRSILHFIQDVLTA